MDEKVINCIYAAIDEVNHEQDDGKKLEKSPSTPIHGSESALDSLGLVNFIVTVEENIEREFDTPLVLGDDRALSREPSPFQSVQALAEYISSLLKEQE